MDKLNELKNIVEKKLDEVDKLEKNDYYKYLDNYCNSFAYIDALEWVLEEIDIMRESHEKKVDA